MTDRSTRHLLAAMVAAVLAHPPSVVADATIPHLKAWQCIQRYETPPPFPAWRTNSGNGYFGGLQMDRSFMAAYGAWLVRKYGGRIIGGKAHGGEAHLWTPTEQMTAAERAWRVRGFNPWPTTARLCGLL